MSRAAAEGATGMDASVKDSFVVFRPADGDPIVIAARGDRAKQEREHSYFLEDWELEPPKFYGLWVWEGEIVYDCDADGDLNSVIFKGEYRRPYTCEIDGLVHCGRGWSE